jgi:hypothetical protein
MGGGGGVEDALFLDGLRFKLVQIKRGQRMLLRVVRAAVAVRRLWDKGSS